MSECECLTNCPFIIGKTLSMPMTVEMLKRRLCKTDNSLCARYAVFKALGHGNVPSSLLPNQFEVANEIIAEAAKAFAL